MKGIVSFVLALLCSVSVPAFSGTQPTSKQFIPKGAYEYAPIVIEQTQDVWPNMSKPSAIFGQIEKESCIHLKHSKCWNPRAELKTHREYGFGLGQATIAYNADGSERFNVFEELRRMDAKMKEWKWEDRYNPKFQIRGLLLKDYVAYRKTAAMGLATEADRLNVTWATYNGGSQVKRQIMCKATPNCDPTRWNPVDTPLAMRSVGPQSKKIVPGYGKSFFDINSEYPDDVNDRSVKYQIFAKP